MIEKIDNIIKRNKWEGYFTTEYLSYFVIGCFGLLGLSLNWSVKELAVVLFLIWLCLFPLKSQILAKIAVACLVITPIMLILNNNNRAETFAEIAYLFLVLTVIMAIVEHFKERKK